MSMDDTDHALEVYEAFHPNAKAHKAGAGRRAALAELIGKVASEAFNTLTEDPPPQEKDDAAAQALLQAVRALTEATAAQTKITADLCGKVEAQGAALTDQAAAIRELASAQMADVVPVRGPDKLITKLTKRKT